MKARFSFATITIITLVFTELGNAQENLPAPDLSQPVFQTRIADTLKKTNAENGIAAAPVPDSKKTKKRKFEQREFYNPYQPYNPVTIAPRYNSSLPYYPQPKETIFTGIGTMLTSILADKTRH